MTPKPEWLKWVRPTPIGELDIEEAVVGFDRVVGYAQLYGDQSPDVARRAKAALRAIQVLPCDLRERPEAIAFMQALEFRINLIGEPRKKPANRPTKNDKRLCIIFTWYWLRDRGSHISGGETGTLPNLALAVWTAAGLNQEDEKPKAWAQLWKRYQQEKIRIQIEEDNHEGDRNRSKGKD